MTQIPISALPVAAAIQGSEPVPIVQVGNTVQTTTGAILQGLEQVSGINISAQTITASGATTAVSLAAALAGDGNSLVVNPATGLLSVANVSGGTVMPAGATTSRLLAAWFSDLPSIAGWGADSTGSEDSSAAFNSAVVYAQTTNKLTFFVPPGVYSATALNNFTGVVPAMLAVGAELQNGNFSTLGQAPGSFLSNAQASGLTLMRMLTGPVNQAAMIIEATMGVSSPTVSYEKMGLYVNVQSLDATNYSTNVTKDCVGAQFNATASVTDSRVWGASISVTNPASVVGNLCGLEIDVNNLGPSAISNINTPGGQCGLLIVSLGNSSPTNGALITSTNGASSAFGYGFVVNQDAVSDYAFYYGDQATSPLFSVGANGAVQSAASGEFASLTVNGSIIANQISANTNVTASALVAIGTNSLTILGSATGNPVTLTASGADSDVSISYSVKGTGQHLFNGSLVINPGSTLTLGNAYTTSAPTATGYVEVTDSSGRITKLLAA